MVEAAHPPAAEKAADQLVRLTRLVIDAEDRAAPAPPIPRQRLPAGESAAPGRRRRGADGGAGPRKLRHNGAELTEREQRVFGLLVQGHYNGRLADALEISERAVEVHLRTLLTEFGAPVRVQAPPPPRRRSPRRRTMTALLAPVAGTVVLCGAPQVVMRMTGGPAEEAAPLGGPPVDGAGPLGAYGVAGQSRGAALRFPHRAPNGPFRMAVLPNGVATATSFWDPATARGKRMAYRTLASPYWPLGTRVKIAYGRESAVGVVEDFGPADWAVAQHRVPAIIDISEAMMADLTGRRANAVRVRFEVLEWGEGDVYRQAGPGYELATGED